MAELKPVAGLDDASLRKALAAAGMNLDTRSEATVGAWASAALREAVENEPVPVRAASSRTARQALSPRSTRGATRA